MTFYFGKAQIFNSAIMVKRTLLFEEHETGRYFNQNTEQNNIDFLSMVKMKGLSHLAAMFSC